MDALLKLRLLICLDGLSCETLNILGVVRFHV